MWRSLMQMLSRRDDPEGFVSWGNWKKAYTRSSGCICLVSLVEVVGWEMICFKHLFSVVFAGCFGLRELLKGPTGVVADGKAASRIRGWMLVCAGSVFPCMMRG